jgi:hypothetical protein
MASELVDFSNEEKEEAALLLELRHQEDAGHMPGLAPGYAPEAALWAAISTYRVSQLLLLRDVPSGAIPKWLPPYPGAIGPKEVYSADLCLRYIPQLIGLAKKLAPDDPLLIHLNELSSIWPFSCVGIVENTPQNVAVILTHPSLLQEYVDRVIASKAVASATYPDVRNAIQKSLGLYPDSFWAEWLNNPSPKP